MKSQVRPVVVISKCLEHAPCRWNGLIIPNLTVRLLKPYVRFIAVCPETEIGLGVPRGPLHLVQVEDAPHLIQDENREDLSRRMHGFINVFFKHLPPVDGFILKAHSPSCGYKDVKIFSPGDKSSPLFNKGSGFFAEAAGKYFPNQVIITETGLSNLKLREHFLIKLFTLSRFKLLKSHPCLEALKRFHSTHKYLIMAYNPAKLKKLEKIAANNEQKPLSLIFSEYERELGEVFSRPPSFQTQAQVLRQVLACLATKLSLKEKNLFLENLEYCRFNKQPLAACRDLLSSWILRFNNQDLAAQALFFPYPEDLLKLPGQ